MGQCMGGMVISIEFIPIYVAKGSVKIKVIIFFMQLGEVLTL
jgi:hypothetical protein